MKAKRKCGICGKPLEYRGKGRRKFCGAPCYEAAHNERRRAIPRYVFEPGKGYIVNRSPRLKSKVW